MKIKEKIKEYIPIILMILVISSAPIVVHYAFKIEKAKSIKSYEYKLVFISDNIDVTLTNMYGKHGWEAVTYRRANMMGDIWGMECLLKREIK